VERPGLDRSWRERPSLLVEVVPRSVVVEAHLGPVELEGEAETGPSQPQAAAPASAPSVPPSGAGTCGPVTVHFAFADTRLDAEGRVALARLASCVGSEGRLRLVGHSDVRGGAGYNVPLGMGRAQTVAGFLRGMGLRPEQLELTSAGHEQPACFGDAEACHRRNRRVEVLLLSPPPAADAPP
jgi:outer membrane protein OmpA-like peptidoglycan-associated protein